MLTADDKEYRYVMLTSFTQETKWSLPEMGSRKKRLLGLPASSNICGSDQDCEKLVRLSSLAEFRGVLERDAG